MIAVAVGIVAGFVCLLGLLGITKAEVETTDLALIIALSISIIVPLVNVNAQSQKKNPCNK